jgi:putative spermidine/putrescine transport system permease protein
MNTLAETQPGAILIDGIPLKDQLAKAERKKKITAFLLVTPLLLFIIITFVLPIGSMLLRSVENPRMVQLMPHLVEELDNWQGGELPSEQAYQVLFEEIQKNIESGDIGKVANHVNYQMAGARSMILKSKRKFKKITGPPYKEQLIAADKRWGEIHTWDVMKGVSDPITSTFFLNAVDRAYDPQGNIVQQPEEKRLYVTLFIRTLWISALVTFLTLLLGYPIAYLISTTPPRISSGASSVPPRRTPSNQFRYCCS